MAKSVEFYKKGSSVLTHRSAPIILGLSGGSVSDFDYIGEAFKAAVEDGIFLEVQRGDFDTRIISN